MSERPKKRGGIIPLLISGAGRREDALSSKLTILAAALLPGVDGEDAEVRFWDVITGRLVRSFRGRPSGPFDLALSLAALPSGPDAGRPVDQHVRSSIVLTWLARSCRPSSSSTMSKTSASWCPLSSA